jgi:hypothetical protein
MRVTQLDANNTNHSRHVKTQPAGRLPSLRLSFYMANHAMASTSTNRCANAGLLLLAAIKPNHVLHPL